MTRTIRIALAAAILTATIETTAADRQKQPTPQPAPPDDAPVELLEKYRAGPRVVPAGPRTGSHAVQSDAGGVVGGTWVAQGPGPIIDGQVAGITDRPVIGAVQTIVAHPSNADIVWLGAVNGGVWKTTNATAANPTWIPTTDGASSLSIGALALDPTDATSQTLVAGIGRFSSYARVGGARSGILRTSNGGTSWTVPAAALLSGGNINGLVVRGTTIVASVDEADVNSCGNTGVFRSTDSGANFTRVSGAVGSGLTAGIAHDVVGDPTNNAVFYAAIRGAGCAGAVSGIYKSTNSGGTWTRVSSAAIDTLMATSTVNNARLAVGMSGQVYAGIMNNGQLAGLYRGANGTVWTQLDTPSTNEGGTIVGLQPRVKPGGQGALHFAIAADPTNANIVYVGGDRQPVGPNNSFPNSLGATNFTGRLFLVDASLASGSQARSLTNCPTATAACGGVVSTTQNGGPHADSRRIVFDAAGNLLEGDDGGIYKRTNPRGTGNWFSVNGTAALTEAHDVAYDAVSNMIIVGTQDVGSAEQTSVGGTLWRTTHQGDGGDVAVDDSSSAAQSWRFASSQNIGGFARRVMNASGALTSSASPALTVTGGGAALVPRFITYVEVNAVAPARMLVAGTNDLYESVDRADTITALGLNQEIEAMVYGGRSGGVPNANLIWAITSSSIFVRTSGTGAPVATATTPPAVFRDIAVDPTDWRRAYVITTDGDVFQTTNSGATWTSITGDLGTLIIDLYSIVVVPGGPAAVVVGGLNGAFRMPMDNPAVWTRLGSGLSNAPVWDLDYDVTDDVLVASTMGRGVWKLNPVANLGVLPTLTVNDVTVTEGNTGTANATFTVSMAGTTGATVTVDYATQAGTAIPGGPLSGPAMSVPSMGNASPYPSPITVTGLSGTVTGVSVTLNGLTSGWPADLDILLVGPGGQSVVLMSDVGTTAASEVDLTFSDAAAGFVLEPVVTGTYRPTNAASDDAWSAPAPTSGYGSALSVFTGGAANGTWSLYVTDDEDPDSDSIAGWTLNISTSGGSDYTAAAGSLSFPPGVATRTITVPVLGDTMIEPNETFLVNLTNAFNATIADAQGIGTIGNDDGPAVAPTNLVATATGASSVALTWTASAGAASYRVYRSEDRTAYSLVGSAAATTYTDTTATANKAYLYAVRALAGSESGNSNLDLATTTVFTDPTLAAGVTVVKVAHFAELLTAVNAVRLLAGQSAAAFTAPVPAAGVTAGRQHIVDLRSALGAARSVLGLGSLTFTDATITAGSTQIRAAHLTELRDALK